MRYRLWWLITFTVVALYAYAPVVQAIDDRPVFVSVDTLSPFLYQDKEGIKGPVYELSRVIFNRMGRDVNIELYSFPLIIRYLEEGSVDGVLMIYRNTERQKFILYPDEPLWESAICIYVKRGREFNFRTVADLYGKRVGNRTDFFVSDEFTRAVNQNLLVLDEARELSFNLKKLLAGRIDCYVGDVGHTHYMIDKLDMGNEVVELLPPLVPKAGLYMALSKKGTRIKDKGAFLKLLDQAIREVKKDGTYKAFENEYLSGK